MNFQWIKEIRKYYVECQINSKYKYETGKGNQLQGHMLVHHQYRSKLQTSLDQTSARVNATRIIHMLAIPGSMIDL